MDLNKTITDSINIGDVSITQEEDGLVFKLGSNELRESMIYIDHFARELPKLMESNPQSILIVGLGLGLIPHYLENNYTVPVIDTLDDNPDVIAAAKELGHLNNVGYLEGDMWMFSAERTYDLIVLDIWWDYHIDTFPNRQLIWEALKHKLSPSGKIYVPMSGEVLVW